MFWNKRIKQLEAQVAGLIVRNQILEDRTEILADRMKKSFEEIDQLYSHLVSHEHPMEKPVTEQKPRRSRRKKNGKENNSAD